MLISFCSKYETDKWLNAKSICHWLGKKSTERPFFDCGLLQLLLKKTDWIEIWFFIFFLFFQTDKVAIFPHKGIAMNRTNQRYSDKSSFNSLKTLSNDSTPSTLDQPLWNLLKSDNVQVLPTHSHPILLFSPVSPAAAGADCCSVQMLSH